MVFVLMLISCILGLQAKEIEGYYVNRQGDTIQTTFEIPFNIFTGEPKYGSKIQFIQYYLNSEKKVLKPEMCTDLCIKYPFNTVCYVAVPNYFFKGFTYRGVDSLFMKPQILGPVNLYYYTYSSQSMTSGGIGSVSQSSSSTNGWIMEREKGSHVIKVTYGGALRRDLAEIFYDYPELVGKILAKDKSVIASDTEAVVKIYNEWKLKQLNAEDSNSNN